jgi:predicted esterase
MTMLFRRRAGRDRLEAERLVTADHTHHHRRFQGRSFAEELDSAPPHLVVGLHGLGANEEQLGTLLPLDLPEASVYVGLRASIDYGREAFSWFDPLLDAEHINYEPAVERVADFVLAVRDRTGVNREATTLVGYSQAASLVVAISAQRPDVADNVALGSAALPPALLRLGEGRPHRAFVAVGDKDQFVEADSLNELATGWDTIGGGLIIGHYDIPHVMSPAVSVDISEWISTFTSAVGARPVLDTRSSWKH